MIDLDVIGTLYSPGEYGSEGEVITPSVALPGYHVNTTYPVAEWAAFKVTPATPSRVFGGIPTHFYTFADLAEFEAYRDTANLDVTPPVVPQSVTIRQGCQALEEAGLLATVEDAISVSPRFMQIDWARATTIDRNWPTLQVLQEVLDLTDAQIDNLFIRAAAL
jgi:hypothetical protein